MSTLACVRGDDRLPMLRSAIDPGPLLGVWQNADAGTQGIRGVECRMHQGELRFRVLAVGPAGTIDWGEVPATLYADISATGGGRGAADPVTDGRPTPHYADSSVVDTGPAFLATIDHGFQRVHFQARMNSGMLVVAMFNEFADESGRADFTYREVFVRPPAG